MKKIVKVKRIFTILLIFLLSINSFAAIVSDNDGSAFVTKAEFDALKSNFNKQIDDYNVSLDGKIDGAIASYLSGIMIAQNYVLEQLSNLKDINWVTSFTAHYSGIQYMWAPSIFIGYGATAVGWQNWLSLAYHPYVFGQGIVYDTSWAPDNKEGYIAEVDDRTLSIPYCTFISNLTKKYTDAVCQNYPNWDYTKPTWNNNNAQISAIGIRGRQTYFVKKKDLAPACSATISADDMTFNAIVTLTVDTSIASDLPVGTNINMGGSCKKNMVKDWFNKTRAYDMSNYMLAVCPTTTVCKIPFWDQVNGLEWEIKKKNRAYPTWNSVFMYDPDRALTSDPTTINNSYECNYTDFPYAKVKDNVEKDVITKTYSQALKLQGYPQKYIYNGMPLFKSSKKDSQITFKIKNNSSVNNKFAIKNGSWGDLSTSTGVTLSINNVEKTGGNSGDIAANATVTVGLSGLADEEFWFKSIGNGNWEIIGDIIETVQN